MNGSRPVSNISLESLVISLVTWVVIDSWPVIIISQESSWSCLSPELWLVNRPTIPLPTNSTLSWIQIKTLWLIHHHHIQLLCWTSQHSSQLVTTNQQLVNKMEMQSDVMTFTDDPSHLQQHIIEMDTKFRKTCFFNFCWIIDYWKVSRIDMTGRPRTAWELTGTTCVYDCVPARVYVTRSMSTPHRWQTG